MSVSNVSLVRSVLSGAAMLLALSTIPAGAQGSAEQRAACEGDAMRLCSAYVPDVQRISACMVAHRRYLSPRCRATYYGGTKRKMRRRGRG